MEPVTIFFSSGLVCCWLLLLEMMMALLHFGVLKYIYASTDKIYAALRIGGMSGVAHTPNLSLSFTTNAI